MRGLSDQEVMDIWDRGQRQPAWFRALLPLSMIFDKPIEELLDWPLGLRDGWLLTLRAWTLGPTLMAAGQCGSSRCQKAVEVEIAIQTLLEAWPKDWKALQGILAHAGGSWTLRAVNSRDVAEVSAKGSSPEDLLRRCVVEGGDFHDLMTESSRTAFLAEAERVLDRLDPLSNIELELTCPDCQTIWSEPLNVVEFFWEEIAAAAKTVARDIHDLAIAYGWTEREIFGLSPARRTIYLSLIRGQSRPSLRSGTTQLGGTFRTGMI
ncbi:hypothetical protein [Schlesneria paludicola]|uniref:hypothetical protein n=1 Tax=Schlesneria paludicola TaxID=360056 RepID=UPI00029A192A|nr:hypothetical protein [Schlesneria paludicola]